MSTVADVNAQLQSLRGQTDPLFRRQVRKKFADSLLEKGDIAAAVSQFISGVEDIEPSYVISKLSDVQHMRHLVRYLEELHDEKHGGMVQSCHTALLLNCYARLHEYEEFDRFVRGKSPHLDVKEEIQCCLSAGREDSAMFLSRNFSEPGEAIRLLLKRKSYVDALDFVLRQPVDDAEKVFAEFGRDFVTAIPRRATESLVSLCTQWSGPARRQDVQHSNALPPNRAADPLQFVAAFVDEPLFEILFLKSTIDALDGSSSACLPSLLQRLVELYLVDDISELVVSSPVEQMNKEKHVQVELTRDERVSRALALLSEHSNKINMQRVLSFALQAKCDPVVVAVLTALNRSGDMLWHLASTCEDEKLSVNERQEALKGLYKLCITATESNKQQQQQQTNKKAEAERGDMWALMPQLVARSELPNSGEIMTKLLQQLKSNDVIPPMRVVEALRTAKCTVPQDVVSQYLTAVMSARVADVANNVAKIRETIGQIAAVEAEVKQTATNAKTYAVNKPCAKCEKAIGKEFVLFMCGHCFHPPCVDEMEVCSVQGCPQTALLRDREFCKTVLREGQGGDVDSSDSSDFDNE